MPLRGKQIVLWVGLVSGGNPRWEGKGNGLLFLRFFFSMWTFFIIIIGFVATLLLLYVSVL